jgi:hypothetical protein
VFSRGTSLAARRKALIWGIRGGIDAVVLPIVENGFFSARNSETISREARAFGLVVEKGGWDLSALVFGGGLRGILGRAFGPADLFRMEGGKRIRRGNFCPTSPESLQRAGRAAALYFNQNKETQVFHFWPDRGAEDLWCSCPSCRAFSLNEQRRIAVTAAAAALTEINSEILVSYLENDDDPNDEKPENAAELPPRKNMFKINAPETTAPGIDIIS